jgi:hypothetical protein
VKRAVLLTLKSPRFLYREVGTPADDYDVAARLAFALWGSLPDNDLWAAAAAGRLHDREEVVRQAERMITSPRARARLQSFLMTWLKVDSPPEIAKDATRFAGFDEKMVADLRTSLELGLDDVLWSEGSDFRRLLLDDSLYLNGRLAAFYGADLPADADFTRTKLTGERAGVLTHPYLLSNFAYSAESSPIHRGVFVARGLLGISLKPPPEAVVPLPAAVHPSLTTRERVTLQTKPSACITCHGIINPLGFPLEPFDAVGRFREKEKDKPVDSAGSYLTRAGKTMNFTGPRQLAQFLVASEEAQEAFAEQLFHHLVQQPLRAYGPRTQQELREFFIAHDFNIRALAIEVVTRAALTGRSQPMDVAPKATPAP